MSVSAYGSTTTPQPLFEAGKSFSMRLPIASMLARACASVTPSFSRANEIIQWKSRVMFDGLNASGRQICTGCAVERTRRRQDADDRVRLVVEKDRAVDDGRIARRTGVTHTL